MKNDNVEYSLMTRCVLLAWTIAQLPGWCQRSTCIRMRSFSGFQSGPNSNNCIIDR